jgi:anthranilate phosphoribosyltransferase
MTSTADSSASSPREALTRLLAGRALSRIEMEGLFGRLMDGEVSDVMKAALLTSLAAKGETIDEIAGAAAAMRRRVVRVAVRREGVVDTCGTGGDGRDTFNISTAAALVAAGAGVPIAKHGNRSVSSRSGSADLLEALGVDLDLQPEEAARALDEIGIAFLFAPRFHPAMAKVMAVRRELGVRTIFNILGPLTNPVGARRQVVGVFEDRLVELVAGVLLELGCDHALVVRGEDGLDELSTTGPSKVAEVSSGRIRCYGISPDELGIERATLEDLSGGGPAANAEQLRGLLAGESGPLQDITVLNAAAAIYVGGRVSDLADGIEVARESIRSGAAAAKLGELQHLGRAIGG